MVEYSDQQNSFVISVVTITTLYVMYYCVVEICKDYTNRSIKDEFDALNNEIDMLRLKLSRRIDVDDEELLDYKLSRRVSAGHEAELDLS